MGSVKEIIQSRILTTHSADETSAEGERLAGLLQPGDVVLLTGDLGAGKTHFTKGLVRGLDINECAVSPTFTIVNEYRSENALLNHMDVYRLSDYDELLDIGFEDYLSGGGVTVIEWADRFEELFALPERTFKVVISCPDGYGPDDRRIVIVYPVYTLGNAAGSGRS